MLVGNAGTLGVLSWSAMNGIKRYLEEVMSAFWYKVDGTDMIDMLEGDPLTLSADPGTTYIPATYAGTITAPDVAGLKTADVNNVLFDAGGTPRALSVSDFIDADLERIPVQYDDDAPHHIRAIGLIDDTVYAGLTTIDKKKISNYMNLWVLYWDNYLDAGSFEKENRTWDD